MELKALLFEEKAGIGLVTLNRPETINALNQEMIEDFHNLLDELSTSRTCRVIILTGAGEKGFCSGMDLKESAQQLFTAPADLIYYYQSLASKIFLKLRQIPQPVIAAVNGAASGVGFSLALAADLRIITERARFNAAYINIGLGGADLASSYFLPKMIGLGRAAEFLYTGEFMSADEAMSLGFASRMVPKEELVKSAWEMAEKMTAKDPLGLKMTKEALNQNLGAGSLEAALHMENRNQAFLIAAMKLGLQEKK